MKKVLFINPIYTDVFDQPMYEELNKHKDDDTQVEVVSFQKKKGPTHLVYNAYEAFVLPELITAIKKAEKNGFDAAIIGCFYDPALRASREVSNHMVITAPAEASLHIAATLGERIGIIVGEKKCIQEMKENVVRYGFEHKLAAFKSLDMGVHEFQKDPEVTMMKMRERVRKTIDEDGADVIVLGCTAEFGFYKKIQNEFGIPCIDVSLAALKYAELFVKLKQTFSWTHSKVYGYQSPPEFEMNKWDLFN